MAWIKVEKNTPDKPEIRQIARACNVSPGEAFTAWFRLWAWLDGETADGFVRFLTPDDCGHQARLPGIGNVLAEIGWLEFSSDGGLVIGWEKHNGDSAKKRALTAKRVDKYRKSGHDNGYRPWKK